MAGINKEKTWPQFLSAIGGLLIVVGSFLPWIKAEAPFETITIIGVDYNGGGVTTLILGLVIIFGSIVAIARLKFIPIMPMYTVAIGSLVAVILGIMNYIDVINALDKVSSGYVSGSVGIGIFPVILADFGE